MEKEDEKERRGTKKEGAKQKTSFSSTIKNAHASGDGSIKRSDEAIDIPREDLSEKSIKENNY